MGPRDPGPRAPGGRLPGWLSGEQAGPRAHVVGGLRVGGLRHSRQSPPLAGGRVRHLPRVRLSAGCQAPRLHPPHCPLPPRSRLDKGLAVLVRERGADLVVIEGMGRAVHTNYHAALRCESLKLAVIKNSWLAERLGGRLFSVIFKYEVPAE